MQVPESLETLIEQGIIQEVLRPLMSGKEANLFLIVCGDEERVAKVYKDATNRSFKHRSAYTEGRRVRNTRDQRAMNKHSRHGREQDEAAWRSTEVDMIYRLRAAGVRVPVPYHFIDGVLIMELIKDSDGNPASRLGDVTLDRDEMLAVHATLLREVVKMLCAGVVHGDLSAFNVLMGPGGPVIIDFPQALDAAANQNTRVILQRDVANLNNLLSRFEADGRPRLFAEEMWELYERGALTPDTPLTGIYLPSHKQADVHAVLKELDDVRWEEERRRETRGLPPLRPSSSATTGQARAAHAARKSPGSGGGQRFRPTGGQNPGPRPNPGAHHNSGPRPNSGPNHNSGPRSNSGPSQNSGPRPNLGPNQNSGPRPNPGPNQNSGPRPATGGGGQPTGGRPWHAHRRRRRSGSSSGQN